MRGHDSPLIHGPISRLGNIGRRMLVQESFSRLDLWREQDVSNWLRPLDNGHRPERRGWRPSSPSEKPLLQTLLTDIDSEKRKGSSALIVERGDWQVKILAMLPGHAPCSLSHKQQNHLDLAMHLGHGIDDVKKKTDGRHLLAMVRQIISRRPSFVSTRSLFRSRVVALVGSRLHPNHVSFINHGTG